jgi:hypothetical protein
MSIDYRDQVCNRPVDADGYELPPWLNPFLCDYNAELAALPAERTCGVVPTEADIQWLNETPGLPPIAGGSPEPYEPTDADLEEMARWAEWADRNDEIRQQEDAMDELCRRYAL